MPMSRLSRTGLDESRSSRLQLRLTVRFPTVSVDVALDADPAQPLKAAIDGAARLARTGARRTGIVWCERLGTLLSEDLPLADAGLCHGDVLHVGAVASPHGAPAWHAASVELVVTGGPSAGACSSSVRASMWWAARPAAMWPSTTRRSRASICAFA